MEKIEALGLEIVENTPEEIKDIAMEAIERLEDKWKTIEIDEKLQKKFWQIFSSSKYINSPRFNHGRLKARFSTKFLRKNPEWLQ